MKRLVIEDLSEIAELMYCSIINGENKDVMFVGFYEDAITVLKNLFMIDEPIPYYIDIKDTDWDNYDKEYYVTLDSNMNVWCEKAYDYDNKRYLITETNCLFVADDCNSAILKKIGCDEDDMYEVTYDLDDECECNGKCECCNCNDDHEVITRVAIDEDGKLRGFEKSWETHEDGLHYKTTYSFYSSNQNMLKDMLDNFDIKF